MAQINLFIQSLLFILLFVTTSLCNIKQIINVSTTTSFFSDNNIYEDINSKKIDDNFIQLWLQANSTFKKNQQFLNFSIIGNTQQYFNFSDENKYFGRINFDYLKYLSRTNILSIGGFYSRKSWYQVEKFYDTSILNLAYTRKSGKYNITMNTFIGYSQYSYFSEFDNINYGIRPKLCYRMSKKLSFSLFFESRFNDFQNSFISKKRFDKSNTVNFGFEYKNGMILGSNFEFVNTKSNYDFLINNSVSILPYLSAEFHDIYYQIIVKWNLKKYKNKINTDQVNLVFPDPEANTNNQIYFGFDREFTNKISITGKIIFFASEYKYQADFYEKFLVGIGLKYSF